MGERGRFVDVGVFPMGTDVKQLQVRKKQADVGEWVQVLKQRYKGPKIVVGRDKLDEVLNLDVSACGFFLHTQDSAFSQYLALLTIGNGFIVASLREGMALRPH